MTKKKKICYKICQNQIIKKILKMKSTAYWFSNKKAFSKYKTYAILKIYIHCLLF